MILPRLRTNLDFMPSPVEERPGLLIRDTFQYSDMTLIIPPLLVHGLGFFDGIRTELDLHAELTRLTGSLEMGAAARSLVEAMSKAGFLEDETYQQMKDTRERAFRESPVREAAHVGSAYPDEIGPLQEVMRGYLDGPVDKQEGVLGIAAPHVSPEGGWQSYRAAYQTLTPDLKDRTFVVLGTSHYGEPDRFGLTRKPFRTPYRRDTDGSRTGGRIRHSTGGAHGRLLPQGGAFHRVPSPLSAGDFWTGHQGATGALRILRT